MQPITLKKAVSCILLICFLASQSVYSSEPKPRYTLASFEKEYAALIDSYVNLNKTDTWAVGKFTVELSTYIKEKLDSGQIHDLELESKYNWDRVLPKWNNLKVIQWKLAEYLDMAKQANSFKNDLDTVTSNSMIEYARYLDTLFRNADVINRDLIDITIFESENGNTLVKYNNLDNIYHLAYIDASNIIMPTGEAFDDIYIKENGGWDNFGGIIDHYNEKRVLPVYSITILSQLASFAKEKGYTDLVGKVKKNFARISPAIRSGKAIGNMLSNSMALTQLYDDIYLKAMENALRIYINNKYLNGGYDINSANAGSHAILAATVCRDTQGLEDEEYHSVEYGYYRCVQKMKSVAKDQINRIKSDPATFKVQTMDQMLTEINTQILPKIKTARQNLIKRLGGGLSLGETVYWEDCPEVDMDYYREIDAIAQEHKIARFIYADEDLRDEFFGNPVSAKRLPKSFGMVDVDPKCQISISDVRSSITKKELQDAFDLSQETIKEYAYKLNSDYLKILALFMSQKSSYADQYNFKDEISKEQSMICNSILDVLKTSPNSVQEVFKANPGIFGLNTLLNDQLKYLDYREERDQQFRQFMGVVGAVVGTVLAFTGVFSAAGIELLGISVAALSTAATVSNVAFTAYLGYEAYQLTDDRNKVLELSQKEKTKAALGLKVDSKYLEDLDDQAIKYLEEAIVTGFFAFLGIASEAAVLLPKFKLALGFNTEKETINWFADVSKWLSSNNELFSPAKLLELKDTLGQRKFVIFIRHLQKYLKGTFVRNEAAQIEEFNLFVNNIGSSVLKDKINPRALFLSDLTPDVFNYKYSLFKKWYEPIRFKLRANEGQRFYELASKPSTDMIYSKVGISQTPFTVADAEGLALSPEIAIFLDLPVNKALKDKVCFDLSFLNLKDAEAYLARIKTPADIPGYKAPVSNVIKYSPPSNEVKAAFGEYAECKNWSPEIPGIVRNKEELARYYTIKDNELVQRPCKTREIDAGDEDHDILRKLYHALTKYDLTVQTLSREQYLEYIPEIGRFKTDNNYSCMLFDKRTGEMINYTYPEEVRIVTRNYANKAAMEDAIRANAHRIINQIIYDNPTIADGKMIEEIIKIYLTTVEPTQNAGDCFSGFVAMQKYLIEEGSSLNNSAMLHSYSIRKLIWPPDGTPPYKQLKIPFNEN